MNRTYSLKPKDIKRAWHLIDAKDVILGRLSVETARLLMGKHKADYTPHQDTGDAVVVINAAEIAVTGQKEADKKYWSHTGYPGGIKSRTLGDLRAKCPEQIIMKSVKGMLPKGPLGRQILKRLKVYAGAEHTHTAQQPQDYVIEDRRGS